MINLWLILLAVLSYSPHGAVWEILRSLADILIPNNVNLLVICEQNGPKLS